MTIRRFACAAALCLSAGGAWAQTVIYDDAPAQQYAAPAPQRPQQQPSPAPQKAAAPRVVSIPETHQAVTAAHQQMEDAKAKLEADKAAGDTAAAARDQQRLDSARQAMIDAQKAHMSNLRQAYDPSWAGH